MALSPAARTYGSQNQGVRVGLVHLTILYRDSLVEWVLPIATNINSAGLMALVSGKGLLLPEDRVELYSYFPL